ncbi:MAG: acyltransferase [Terracidiphilus sp.]
MKSKYENLDFLRSMAVLSVVTSHMWHSCVEFHICAEHLFVSAFLRSCAITGVSFFFVHTCLVLMMSMHRAPDAHLARNFLIRRAFRIYPLCWAAIILALTTGLTDLSPAGLQVLRWQDIVANLLLVQNLAKSRNVVCILGPLWSLPWEVQMYLVLPLFYLVLRRFQWLGAVFLIWAGSAILAVVGTLPQVPHLGWAIFPPMFISGMVAYRLLLQQEAHGRRLAFPAWAWPPVVLILFVVAPLLTNGRDIYVPQVAAINACNCFVLGLAIPYFVDLKAKWIVAPAQQIAKYSYGVYLLHVPAIQLCFRYFPTLPIVPKIAASLAFTALFSFVAFHVIEDPLIRMGKRLTQPKPPAFRESA